VEEKFRITPAAALQHGLVEHLAGAQHRRGDVDGDGGVPVVQRLLPDPAILARCGRVIAQDVDLAELGDRSRHHGFDVVLVGDVGAHRDGACTRCARGLANQLLASRGQQHPGALSNEQRAKHRSQAAARSGDDRDFALQPACHWAILPRA
jgi:hypothetical protein